MFLAFLPLFDGSSFLDACATVHCKYCIWSFCTLHSNIQKNHHRRHIHLIFPHQNLHFIIIMTIANLLHVVLHVELVYGHIIICYLMMIHGASKSIVNLCMSFMIVILTGKCYLAIYNSESEYNLSFSCSCWTQMLDYMNKSTGRWCIMQ